MLRASRQLPLKSSWGEHRPTVLTAELVWPAMPTGRSHSGHFAFALYSTGRRHVTRDQIFLSTLKPVVLPPRTPTALRLGRGLVRIS